MFKFLCRLFKNWLDKPIERVEKKEEFKSFKGPQSLRTEPKPTQYRFDDNKQNNDSSLSDLFVMTALATTVVDEVLNNIDDEKASHILSEIDEKVSMLDVISDDDSQLQQAESVSFVGFDSTLPKYDSFEQPVSVFDSSSSDY